MEFDLYILLFWKIETYGIHTQLKTFSNDTEANDFIVSLMGCLV